MRRRKWMRVSRDINRVVYVWNVKEVGHDWLKQSICFRTAKGLQGRRMGSLECLQSNLWGWRDPEDKKGRHKAAQGRRSLSTTQGNQVVQRNQSLSREWKISPGHSSMVVLVLWVNRSKIRSWSLDKKISSSSSWPERKQLENLLLYNRNPVPRTKSNSSKISFPAEQLLFYWVNWNSLFSWNQS